MFKASDARENSILFYKNNKKIIEFVEWVKSESINGNFNSKYYFSKIGEGKIRDKFDKNELLCLNNIGYKISDTDNEGRPLAGYYNVSW